jgi:hypothetical protein
VKRFCVCLLATLVAVIGACHGDSATSPTASVRGTYALTVFNGQSVPAFYRFDSLGDSVVVDSGQITLRRGGGEFVFFGRRISLRATHAPTPFTSTNMILQYFVDTQNGVPYLIEIDYNPDGTAGSETDYANVHGDSLFFQLGTYVRSR